MYLAEEMIAAKPSQTYPVKDIVVEDRIRKDLGDLSGLMDSISENGLMYPIIITPIDIFSYRLIAGERRLESCKRLGMKRIACICVDIKEAEELVKLEIDENINRKSFTKEERVNCGLELERIESVKAEGRKKASQFGDHGGAEISTTVDKGRTIEIVAKKIGIGKSTYQHEKYIVFNKEVLSQEEYDAWNCNEVSTNATYNIVKERKGEGTVRPNLASPETDARKGVNASDNTQKTSEVYHPEDIKKDNDEELPVKEIIKEVIPSDYDSLKEEVASTKAVIDELRAKLSEKDEEIRKISSDARTINSAAFMERNSNSQAAGLISDGQVYDLYAEAEEFFFNKLAPMKWREFMDRASISPNAAEKVLKLVSKVNDWCREMYMILNNTDNDIVV